MSLYLLCEVDGHLVFFLGRYLGLGESDTVNDERSHSPEWDGIDLEGAVLDVQDTDVPRGTSHGGTSHGGTSHGEVSQ